MKKENKKPDRNKSMYVVMSFFVLLFLGMIGYLCNFVNNHEQEMWNNSYNKRQEILASQNYRGSILAAGGEELAVTKVIGDEEIRTYPYAEKFSHVVGFCTQGKTGIESQANFYLIQSNIPLNEKVQNDIAGIKNPGDNVYTTLHVPVQEAAYKALDNYKGAVIVTEVKTGKIIAMVSKPDYDPNQITEIWQDLVEDKYSTVLLNRASQGLYPPGSTFKIITALAYIRQYPDTYTSYRYQCNGYYKKGDNRINCYHGTNHGSLDFTKSFAKSCNSSFANIGMQLDKSKFSDTLDTLLFNDKLPVSFLYSESKVEMNEELSDEAMIQTSIGQWKTQITPLHLNMITASIANGGIMMKPYLIDRVENAHGTVIKQFSPSANGRVMSSEEAEILTELMVNVVENGTATKLSGLNYTAAGKTGSAEYNNVKGDSHAWFTGFAPAEDPEICVTIIVEGAGSGGDYAVPMAKRIFNAWFDEQDSKN